MFNDAMHMVKDEQRKLCNWKRTVNRSGTSFEAAHNRLPTVVHIIIKLTHHTQFISIILNILNGKLSKKCVTTLTSKVGKPDQRMFLNHGWSIYYGTKTFNNLHLESK
jgi:hypothetical protein